MKYSILFFLLSIAGFSCNKSPQTNNEGGDSSKAKVDSPSAITKEPIANAKPDNSDPRAGTKAILDELFALAISGNFEKASPLISAKTEDNATSYHIPCDYSNALDKNRVNKICSKISALLNGAKTTEFSNFSTESESEGTWLLWKVLIVYDDGTDSEQTFALMESLSGGKPFLLGDID